MIAGALAFTLRTPDEPLPAEFKPATPLSTVLRTLWVSPRRFADFGWAWLTHFLVNLGNDLGTLYRYRVGPVRPAQAVHRGGRGHVRRGRGHLGHLADLARGDRPTVIFMPNGPWLDLVLPRFPIEWSQPRGYVRRHRP
jgi:hypothetical protein